MARLSPQKTRAAATPAEMSSTSGNVLVTRSEEAAGGTQLRIANRTSITPVIPRATDETTANFSPGVWRITRQSIRDDGILATSMHTTSAGDRDEHSDA